MAVYSFKTVQVIPVPADQAWDFFSSPANLQTITPPYMGFRVISKHQGDRMYPGQVIEYKVKPLLGIPLYWMTEITHVADGKMFVDEQRKGPYRLWHHQHHFRTVANGVEMTDIVHYQLPLGWLGDLANWLFVKRQLQGIFDFRRQKVEEIFGTYPSLS